MNERWGTCSVSAAALIRNFRREIGSKETFCEHRQEDNIKIDITEIEWLLTGLLWQILGF